MDCGVGRPSILTLRLGRYPLLIHTQSITNECDGDCLSEPNLSLRRGILDSRCRHLGGPMLMGAVRVVLDVRVR
jgi:hypothetical protein